MMKVLNLVICGTVIILDNDNIERKLCKKIFIFKYLLRMYSGSVVKTKI